MEEEQSYPKRVTLGEDQIYRWSYDMDMYHNHYLRNTLLKICFAICMVCWLFMLIVLASDGNLTPKSALITLPFFAGFDLLVLLGYYIAAVIMRGVYHLRFAMNEEAIMLVRKKSTQNMLNVIPLITMSAGMASGKGLRGFATGMSQHAGASSGLTYFRDVRSMRERPQYDAFNLRELVGANQIWVNPEDYDFVRDFIKSRIPERARH